MSGPSPSKNTLDRRHALIVPPLTPYEVVLADLELSAADFPANPAGVGIGSVLVEACVASPTNTRIPEELRRLVDRHLSPEGTCLLHVRSPLDERLLAAWRDALWPLVHIGTIVDIDSEGAISRRTLDGAERLPLRGRGIGGALLVGQRREYVLRPRATVAKFDANAAGWNGTPGTPGWPHHRWMRRFVGTFAHRDDARRILDFGCGAGWCGIEAALETADAELCAFDPSPEMVRLTARNAAAAGIERFVGRTGFGEAPPFPRAGEERFDLVLSSGVISFAYDIEAWLDGLAATVARDGTLVIGDIDPHSRGMRARRRSKPLLPIRELNAPRRDTVRTALEVRGFRHVRTQGYQLTAPVPQLMHLSERRLAGALTWPLLALNRSAAWLDGRSGGAGSGAFDSWVALFER